MRTRHVSTVIRRPPEAVYDFAREPANLPFWAAGLASGQVGDGGGDILVVESPMGPVRVRFLPRNHLGVLDHEVTLPDGSVTYNPLRVVPHPEGAEVVFTLRDIGDDDDEFQRDAAAVAEDLDRLRALLEDPPGPDAPSAHSPAAAATAAPSVRIAAPADAGSLGEMLYAFNTEFGSATPDVGEATRRLRHHLSRDDVLAVVAVAALRDTGDDNSDVGFALVTFRPTPYSDHPLAQLEELYVRPDLRGRGIGAAIIGLVIERIAARRCPECLINVDSDDLGARRFYERHGFTDVDPDSGSTMRCYLRQL